jgi:hypothetical protein
MHQQFLRVSDGNLGERPSRQHASNLAFTRRTSEFTHAGVGNFFNDLF